MFLRLYLFSLYLVLFLSSGLCALILFNVNPFKSPFWMIGIFYLTVFLIFLALFGIIGFYLKVKASNREVIFAHLLPTLRQSMLVALIIIGLLFLAQIRVINWWVGSLFVLAILMFELYFRRK